MTRDERIIAAVQAGKTYDRVANEMMVTRSVVAGVMHRARKAVPDTPAPATVGADGRARSSHA